MFYPIINSYHCADNPNKYDPWKAEQSNDPLSYKIGAGGGLILRFCFVFQHNAADDFSERFDAPAGPFADITETFHFFNYYHEIAD